MSQIYLAPGSTWWHLKTGEYATLKNVLVDTIAGQRKVCVLIHFQKNEILEAEGAGDFDTGPCVYDAIDFTRDFIRR